jgi:hypothetical protein
MTETCGRLGTFTGRSSMSTRTRFAGVWCHRLRSGHSRVAGHGSQGMPDRLWWIGSRCRLSIQDH